MVPLWVVPSSVTGDERVALVLTCSCAGLGVQGGTGQPMVPPTVNVALRICVTLVEVTTLAVIVWLPFDSVPVLNPWALPLAAVPAKSSGAKLSVRRGVPAMVGLSR